MLQWIILFQLVLAHATVDLVTDPSGIKSYLQHKAGWSSGDITWQQLILSEGRITRIYYSKVECGVGTCTQYAFEQLATDRWTLVGIFEGQIEILGVIRQNHHSIKTTSKLGQEVIEQIFDFDGRTYILKP